MKNYVLAGMALVSAVAMTSCGNSEYKKTETGMMYDIIADGKGEKVKHGELIKIHFKLMIGDSVLEDTWKHLPAYGMVDSTMKNQHNFTDILTMMKVGDSAVFVRSLDTLKKMNQLPPTANYPAGSTMKGYLKILGRFKDEAELQVDYKKEETAELKKESSNLEKYLQEKGIKAIKTPKGAFVVVTEPGTGMVADSGKQVSVLYHGTTKEGKPFDSTKDSAFGHVGKPYEFVIGRDPVVEGWVECLPYFKQGGKGQFYIPAMLAYKNQAKSEALQAYTDLIFDIEVVSVKVPSPVEATPPMPGQ
ncbi:MAG: FKBP-type peptidyl-prolyl cis-trans isomerase [Bacteroidota bacterium]